MAQSNRRRDRKIARNHHVGAGKLRTDQHIVPHGHLAAELDLLAEHGPAPHPRAGIDALRARGVAVTFEAVAGPGFWQSVETERCAALVAATVAALDAPSPNGVARDPVLL